MFNKKLKEYKKQIKLNEKMQRYTDTDKNYYLTTNMVLNLAQKTEQIFENSKVSEKEQLLNFLLQNLKLKGKKLLFELKTPFNTQYFKRTSILISLLCSPRYASLEPQSKKQIGVFIYPI